jgi:anthranilate phosphoribosyltransferase
MECNSLRTFYTMKPEHLFEQLINKQHLDPTTMQEVILQCISGQLTDTQIAVFLALMRSKGETAEELATAAMVMQRMAHVIDLGPDVIDIVGTGGDGKNTFNVSTAASFVIAASGIPVAKHGNRSVSSRSGSADLLQEAGFVLELSDEQVMQCIAQCNIVFLFGPHYHAALAHAKDARRQLGIRTLFNLLGPLVNPACVKKQVVGVYQSKWLRPLAHVLVSLGSERALVLSSEDGLDEVSIAAPTEVIEYKNGAFHQWMIEPQNYKIHYTSLDDIIIDGPQQSLKLILSVLSGELGAARDMVILNAATGIYCAHDELTFESALKKAAEAIDSGRANACFQKLQLLTQTLGSGK